jgi:hypothetical protein
MARISGPTKENFTAIAALGLQIINPDSIF